MKKLAIFSIIIQNKMDESAAIILLSLILAAFLLALILIIVIVIVYYCGGYRFFPRRVSLVPTLIHHDHPMPFVHLPCQVIGCRPPLLQMPPPETLPNPPPLLFPEDPPTISLPLTQL